MDFPPIQLPDLPPWAQQLANILPVTVVIEFIDVSIKLHVFQLNGTVPLWSWPMTPTGARLVCKRHENIDTDCCLDQAREGAPNLTCIDGRYGDCYPSSAPTTVRLCFDLLTADKTVLNWSNNLKTGRPREQRLNIVLVSRLQPKRKHKLLRQLFGTCSARYCATSLFGWFLLLGIFCVCIISGLYVAAAYLFLMPLTGYLVFILHGGSPRKLDDRHSDYQRLIVAADNLNATDWWGVFGGSFLVNSFLNRSLYRESRLINVNLVRWLLQFAILSQWVFAVASSVQQSWSALIISFWVLWCAVSTDYIYRPKDGVQDWLRYTCHVALRRMTVKFSSRRAMLGALVLLNPDTSDGRVQWIDPILAEGPDRSEWLNALLDFLRTQNYCKPAVDKFFWRWIEEGVAVGNRVKSLLKQWRVELGNGVIEV